MASLVAHSVCVDPDEASVRVLGCQVSPATEEQGVEAHGAQCPADGAHGQRMVATERH